MATHLTDVQQSILQQAQAAAAAQTDPARPTRQGTLHEADLVTPDVAEDDIPLPVYGDTYGEIRGEKDGLGTSANVTDDGRVNIRINQINRRLSQIFTPALRQQLESVQDSRPPPPPYVPPDLGGEDGVPLPPHLNIVIQVVGSRGDVQPFIALGKVLKATYGHRVRIATHPNFKDFVQENDLEFFSIGGDPSQLMAFMVKNPSLMPGFRSLLSGDIGQRRRDVAEYIQGCWRSCYETGDGMSLRAIDNDLSALSGKDPGPEHSVRPFVADCIIANPPSFAHIHCAERLGIPLHIMFTMPYSPTQAFPHPLANIQSSNADPQLTNYISYIMIEILSWQGLGDIINRFRAKCLGLDPVSLTWAPGMLQRLKIPHTYCWSPALIPKPKDWGAHISISGFYFLDLASNYTPTSDFQAFLDAGQPPVYIGFGSIVLDDPNAMTELIFEVVRKTGQRVLLSKGWGGMGADELSIPDGVFMLDNVPHDWLFKHVSCVVHHGGAGTTAAGIAAGRPTVVVPFFGDQPFWGTMIARAGAGPDPIPHKQLTADKLADAINFCLKPESLQRAKVLASTVATERGSDMGAQSFHQYLEADRLRCTLAPSRSATWRIKHTQIRLSAFAACTLANADLLDFRDLKLFRAQEYETDEGPWDPVSGGAAACYRAFSGMVMGLAEVPSETLKTLLLPIGSSRQQSRESVPTTSNKNEISRMGERSASPMSPEQNRTSFNMQESLNHVQSTPDLSGLSTPTSNIGSSSISNELQSPLSHKQNVTNRSRVRNRDESSFGKDQNVLRQTYVHSNKGFGRIIKAAVTAPVEVSVGITKGFHNLPKLWGDDTVRPQEQVSDFKSGAMAAGKEFGFGWYDGVTGLVTQPWKGAQEEGASGFFKGFGKGIVGFATKPLAGFSGILGHTMKGVQKEVQKLFGRNVQSYIVASRVAQGYEEWLKSYDAEKQDVIVRWKLIQKYLKKKNNSGEMVQDTLEAQQKMNLEDREDRENGGHTARSAQSAQFANSADDQNRDLENSTPTSRSSQAPLRVDNAAPVESSEATEIMSREDAEEDDDGMEREIREIQELVSEFQSQRQDHQADQENLRQASAISETEAWRHANHGKWDSDLGFNAEDNEESEQEKEESEMMSEKAVAVAGGSPGSLSHQRSPSYDPGHLAGTTRSEFETQQNIQQTEKTTQEKTEEDIVMEYIKKQSLLEMQHLNNHKGLVTTIKDQDDEDLQKALKLSMQEHGDRYGEASGI